MSTPVRLETRQQKRRFLGGMALGLVASVYGLARRDIDAGFAIVMLVVFAVAAWAWQDGGREPVHVIVQPVPVPEMAR